MSSTDPRSQGDDGEISGRYRAGSFRRTSEPWQRFVLSWRGCAVLQGLLARRRKTAGGRTQKRDPPNRGESDLNASRAGVDDPDSSGDVISDVRSENEGIVYVDIEGEKRGRSEFLGLIDGGIFCGEFAADKWEVAMTGASTLGSARWFLRLSIAGGFLSAVADRFGVWGGHAKRGLGCMGAVRRVCRQAELVRPGTDRFFLAVGGYVR
jgi:hypothetical protein